MPGRHPRKRCLQRRWRERLAQRVQGVGACWGHARLFDGRRLFYRLRTHADSQGIDRPAALLRELLKHEDAYEIVTFEDTQKAPRGFAFDTQTAFA